MSAFPTRSRTRVDAEPAVTVLKPLHGAEPDLADRLAAFCRQHYGGPVQVVCGAQGDLAPATAAVGEVNSKFPDRIELVADQRSHGANGKVSNLINMLPRARYDTIVLSDSDIVVERDYLRRIVALSGRARCRCRHLPLPRHRRRRAVVTHIGAGDELAFPAAGHHRARPRAGQTMLRRHHRFAPPMLDRIGGFHALRRRTGRRSMRSASPFEPPATTSRRRRSWSATAVSKAACASSAAPDPRGAHHQEHRPDRLRRHHLDPSVAARSSRLVLRRHRRDAFVSSRCWRSRVTLCRCVERRFGFAAAELSGSAAAGCPGFRRLCGELLRGDGALAGRRLPRLGRMAPCLRKIARIS